MEDEDFTTFASILNDLCEVFKQAELSPDNSKLVQGLVSTKDAELMSFIFNKVENEHNLSLQNLAEDCQRFINDAKYIEENGKSHVKKCLKKIKWVKNITPNPGYACKKLHFIMI